MHFIIYFEDFFLGDVEIFKSMLIFAGICKGFVNFFMFKKCLKKIVNSLSFLENCGDLR